MSKKGFTLIELLAVIVILAIIALVAVPLILNVIEESKRGAAKESATNYAKQVESALTVSLMDGESILTTGLYTLDSNGNIESPIKLEVPMKGDKAKEGSICIGEKGSVMSYSLKIGNYYVTSNDGTNQEITDKLVELDCAGSTEDGEEAITSYDNGTAVYFNPETNTKCKEADYQANLTATGYSVSSPTGLKTGCMKWYLFNNDDASTTINMILDHNTTAFVQWNSSGRNTSGMGEVATALSNDTATWNSGLNARLITADEVAKITGNESFDISVSTVDDKFYFDSNNQTQTATGQGTSAYAWLFDYTADAFDGGCTNHGCNVDDTTTGYWTSTPEAGSTQRVWRVHYEGMLVPMTVNYYHPDFNDGYGVRPVITASKEIIK